MCQCGDASMCQCGDLQMWRCDDLSLSLHIGISPHRHIVIKSDNKKSGQYYALVQLGLNW